MTCPSSKSFLFVVLLALSFCAVVLANERFDRVCKGRKLQVLSDVDDTIKASGTNFIAGTDTRWPGGSLYAGLGFFYLELSRGPSSTLEPLSPGIVSARPKQLGGAFPDFEGELEIAAKQTKGLPQDWPHVKVILPGEVYDNLHIHEEKRYRDYALTKFTHVKEFAQQNPDKCIIFMGDNGQGDQLGGKMMLEEIPDQVAAVFIHNVTNTPPLKVEPVEDIYLFHTYVDAILIAYEKGFVPKEAVYRVIEGALSSNQYELCRSCYPPPEDDSNKITQTLQCLLAEVKPHFSDDGGGCNTLFSELQRVSSLSSYSKPLRLPKAPLRRAIEAVVDVTSSPAQSTWLGCIFGCVFWWSVIAALAAAIISWAWWRTTREAKKVTAPASKGTSSSS